MRILMDDGLQKQVATGIGSYAAYLGEALSRLPQTEVVFEDFTPPSGNRKKARFSYLRYLSSRRYREKLKGVDVVHYANYAMPRKLPKHVISAVTVHDMTAFLHPETLPPAYAYYNRFAVRRALKSADVIFTVSQAVKAEIAAAFPAAAEKIAVVPPGVYTGKSEGAVAETFRCPALQTLEKQRYFLFVGTLERRKNLLTLLKAYRTLLRTEPAAKGMALVLVGRRGFGFEAFQKELTAHPIKGEKVLLTGFLSDADCRKLYGEAAAFVFPSIYEGFGSPQTECMAAGLPLLLSDIPTNREVSEGYGAFFPPRDENALALLMGEVARGEVNREALAFAGREKCLPYTFERAARATRAAYLAAMAAKGIATETDRETETERKQP